VEPREEESMAVRDPTGVETAERFFTDPIVIDEDRLPERFTSKHWVYSPLPDGRGLVVLTGIVGRIPFSPIHGESRRRDTVSLGIYLDPVFRAAGYPPENTLLWLRYWAPHITFSFIGNNGVSKDVFYAVEAFRVRDPHIPRRVLWLEADLRVTDTDGWIFGLSYNVTLIGEFIPARPEPI
jgi:hypothetical protein